MANSLETHSHSRVKVFMWGMLHRRTSTFSYLYRLNIGLERECGFYGLEREIDDHLLWRCQKSMLSWNVIGCYVGVELDEIAHFTNGHWITKSWKTRCESKCFESTMVACAWLIWKARCNFHFQLECPKFSSNRVLGSRYGGELGKGTEAKFREAYLFSF